MADPHHAAPSTADADGSPGQPGRARRTEASGAREVRDALDDDWLICGHPQGHVGVLYLWIDVDRHTRCRADVEALRWWRIAILGPVVDLDIDRLILRIEHAQLLFERSGGAALRQKPF